MGEKWLLVFECASIDEPTADTITHRLDAQVHSWDAGTHVTFTPRGEDVLGEALSALEILHELGVRVIRIYELR